MKKTICLNMIVKNETKNLERLFKSLHKVIDYYVIHDTGSTDGTPEKIKEILGNYNISGEIHHEKWKNFGYNRQKAIDSLINSDYKADSDTKRKITTYGKFLCIANSWIKQNE